MFMLYFVVSKEKIIKAFGKYMCHNNVMTWQLFGNGKIEFRQLTATFSERKKPPTI